MLEPLYFYSYMDCTATRITYRDTGAFSGLMTDYLSAAPALAPFYRYPVNWEGFREALEKRKLIKTDRLELVAHLKEQYDGIDLTPELSQNIDALAQENSFTVVTAHQPNLFTGPLYFIYKILHAIKLSEAAAQQFPGYRFVPVYYMGNEDADLDELGHFHLQGEKIEWKTPQTGAVGWMKIDDELIKLINRIEGELGVRTNGQELVNALRRFYKKGSTIQSATLQLVNYLFGRYGLVVIIADSRRMKQQMIPIFEKELFENSAGNWVEPTAEKLATAGYKVQAHPREINLFYLADGIRNRIEKVANGYIVHQTDKEFSTEEMRAELHSFPERFSPNVILRGIFQETILPNIAFIGGGGETAYWLQLKELFDHYQVPFPMLVVRNSFLLMNERQYLQTTGMGLTATDLFEDEEKILQQLALRNNPDLLNLDENEKIAVANYDAMMQQAGRIDQTLVAHVEALKTRAIHQIQELEKKMIRAGKRKLSDERRQINSLKKQLFPKAGLQERTESFMGFFADNGQQWIDSIYRHSLTLEQQFVVLTCQASNTR